MTIYTVDPSNDTPGPFESDEAYAQFVLAMAVKSWQQQFPGSTLEGAVRAARLQHNAGLTGATSESAVPLSVTSRQARLALLGAGMDGAVDAAIAAMDAGPAKRAAQITWEYSLEVQRYHPLITQMSAGLGLTDAQIDQLFIAAKAIP